MTWMNKVWLDVSLNPDPSKLPGGGTLADLGNGLLGWGLIMTAVAFGFGGALWAAGSVSSNMAWAERGKQTLVVAAIAALMEGAAAIIVNFFFHLGAGLH